MKPIKVERPPADTGWTFDPDESRALGRGMFYPKLLNQLSHPADMRVTAPYKKLFLEKLNAAKMPLLFNHERNCRIGRVLKVWEDSSNGVLMCDFEIGGPGVSVNDSSKYIHAIINAKYYSLSLTLKPYYGYPLDVSEISVCKEGMYPGTNILLMNTGKYRYIWEPALGKYEHGYGTEEGLKKAELEFWRDFNFYHTQNLIGNSSISLLSENRSDQMFRFISDQSTHENNNMATTTPSSVAQATQPVNPAPAQPAPPAVVAPDSSTSQPAPPVSDIDPEVDAIMGDREAIRQLLTRSRNAMISVQNSLIETIDSVANEYTKAVIALNHPSAIDANGNITNSFVDVKSAAGNDVANAADAAKGDGGAKKDELVLGEDAVKMIESFKNMLFQTAIKNSGKDGKDFQEAQKYIAFVKNSCEPLMKGMMDFATLKNHLKTVQPAANSFQTPSSAMKSVQQPPQTSRKRASNDEPPETKRQAVSTVDSVEGFLTQQFKARMDRPHVPVSMMQAQSSMISFPSQMSHMQAPQPPAVAAGISNSLPEDANLDLDGFFNNVEYLAKNRPLRIMREG